MAGNDLEPSNFAESEPIELEAASSIESSLNNEPPRIVSTSFSHGSTVAVGTSRFSITFNEPLLNANDPNLYRLISAGADGLLLRNEEGIKPLWASQVNGTVKMEFPITVEEGFYRLTVSNTILDLDGNSMVGKGSFDFFVNQDEGMELDKTFGLGGKVTVNLDDSEIDIQEAVPLLDGKLIVVGKSEQGISFRLIRLNADGSLDTSYGDRGSLTIETRRYFLPASWNVRTWIQADGSFYITNNYLSDYLDDGVFEIVRFQSDGNRDQSFGQDGKSSIPRFFSGSGESLIQQPDGKIVVAGGYRRHSNLGSSDGFVVVRLNSDGKLDTTFSNDGLATATSYATVWREYADAVTIQSDGSIIVAGTSGPSDLLVARFTRDGRFDTQFGMNGWALVSPSSVRDGRITDVVALQNDRLVVGYHVLIDHEPAVGMKRFLPDGFEDWEFGKYGDVVFESLDSSGYGDAPQSHSNNRMGRIVAQSDGKTIVAASRINSRNFDIELTRYDVRGELDESFGKHGRQLFSVGSGNDLASKLLQQPDGKLVVLGDSIIGYGYQPTLIRLQPYESSVRVGASTGFAAKVDTTRSGHGQLFQNGVGGIDILNTLTIGEKPMEIDGFGRLENDGRTYVSPTTTVSGVEIHREVSVPTNGNVDFIRTIDVFSNKGKKSVSMPIRLIGNLSSDDQTTVFATSDGDLLVEPTDTWFGTDDADANGGQPAVIHFIRNENSLSLVSSEVAVAEDYVVRNFSLTVPAGQTKRVATYTLTALSRQAAIDSIATLYSSGRLTDTALSFLSQDAIDTLANFQHLKAPTDIQFTASRSTAFLSTSDSNNAFGESHSYVMSGGLGDDDNPLFSIVGNRLIPSQTFNFQNRTHYSVRIKSTDSTGLSFAESLRITAADIDDSAPIVVSTGSSVSQSVGAGDRSMTIRFSQAMNETDDLLAFQLRRVGTDDLLLTSDAFVNPTTVDWDGERVVLSFAEPFANDIYRISFTEALTDRVFNPLTGKKQLDFVVNEDEKSSLDSSWGVNGVAAVKTPQQENYPRLAVQADGKTVLLGHEARNDRVKIETSIFLQRFNADGSVDSTFGENGRTTTILTQFEGVSFQEIAILPDGKLLVALRRAFNWGDELFLFRYNGDGSLDQSFHDDGKVVVSVDADVYFQSRILIQPDGKIVLGGARHDGTNSQFAVFRLNADGGRDESFGNQGLIVVAVEDHQNIVSELAILDDGRLVAGGSSDNNFAVLRFNVDGTLDRSFGVDGITKVGFGVGSADVGSIDVLRDGRILLGGSYYPGGRRFDDSRIAVVRLHSDGTLDSSFAENGRLTTKDSPFDHRFLRLNVQEDGKLLLLQNGYSEVTVDSPRYSNSIEIKRYNLDGSLDGTFDGRHVLAKALRDANFLFSTDMHFNTDGSLYVAGSTFNEDTSNNWSTDFSLIRLVNEQDGIILKLAVAGNKVRVDGAGFGSGSILHGPDDVFGGLNKLIVNNAPFQNEQASRLQDSNQTVAFSKSTISGLEVSREVTVPATGGHDFIRTIETFTNTTSRPIAVPVRLVGNLGSDEETTVFATSDGDTLVEPTDTWFGTDDADPNGGTPAVIHWLRNNNAFSRVPSRVSVVEDNVDWTFNLTVPPGETQRLATFTIIGATRQAALQSVAALNGSNGFDGKAAEFLTREELVSLVNFQNNLPPAEVRLTNVVGTLDESPNAVYSIKVAEVQIDDDRLGNNTVTLAGSDAGFFEYVAGGLYLKAGTVLDYESKPSYSITVNVDDTTVGATPDASTNYRLDVINVREASVASRQVFYNGATGSVFRNGSDNPVQAIDTTKTALLPGQTASFANYTNYQRGLNGIVVDVANLGAAPTAADFQFAVWNGITAGGFVSLEVVPTVSVFRGGGAMGQDRMKIEFPDGAVKNTWLRITMKAGDATDLASDDVFYFGNAVGDTGLGNSPDRLSVVIVDAADIAFVRSQQSAWRDSASIASIADINRDGRINASDTAIVRQNQSATGALKMFASPSSQRPASRASLNDIALADLSWLNELPSRRLRNRFL